MISTLYLFVVLLSSELRKKNIELLHTDFLSNEYLFLQLYLYQSTSLYAWSSVTSQCLSICLYLFYWILKKFFVIKLRINLCWFLTSLLPKTDHNRMNCTMDLGLTNCNYNANNIHHVFIEMVFNASLRQVLGPLINGLS